MGMCTRITTQTHTQLTPKYTHRVADVDGPPVNSGIARCQRERGIITPSHHHTITRLKDCTIRAHTQGSTLTSLSQSAERHAMSGKYICDLKKGCLSMYVDVSVHVLGKYTSVSMCVHFDMVPCRCSMFIPLRECLSGQVANT